MILYGRPQDEVDREYRAWVRANLRFRESMAGSNPLILDTETSIIGVLDRLHSVNDSRAS